MTTLTLALTPNVLFFLAALKSSLAVMMMSPTPSGQPADVGDDSERRGGPDGLRSAPHSNGRLGGHWLGPDSKHTAVEVSLRSSQSSGPARDEATGGANYTFALHPTVMRLKTGARPHHGPAFRT